MAVVLAAGCNGPEATDAVLCQDVIQRLCAGPRCGVVEQRLGVGDDCDATLIARTGCAENDFSFTAPSRNRWLECRIPLVRQSTLRTAAPGCDNVSEALASCPDVEAFLKGTK